MKTIVTVLALALSAIAQEQATKAPAKLSREAQLEIQNIALQEKSAEEELQKIAARIAAPFQQKRAEVMARVCGEAGIEVKECLIDTEKNIVTKRPADSTKK